MIEKLQAILAASLGHARRHPWRIGMAMAFASVFAWVPEVNRNQAAYLEIRSTLMQGDQSPFWKALSSEGRMPLLHTQIIEQSQKRDAPVVKKRRARNYERLGREWARSATRSEDGSRPTKVSGVDPSLPALTLQVRTGANGYSWMLTTPGARAPQKLVSNQSYPARSSLVPAFLAIILAILTTRVIPSLFLGCLSGAVLYTGGLFSGAGHFFADTIWKETLTESFNLRIMGFVIFLFAAVGVMSRSGGIAGMVEWIRRFAKGPISTQLCSFAVGILIFFDDYSNCIITGSTMRPLTDRNRVSREKLAYIVDSTAAPVAGISIFSTWVAYEVSMFAGQLPEVTRADGTAYRQTDGFAVFIQTLPFRFYCIFTLLMVVATIVLRREFGPMLSAERRAFTQGKPIADDAQPIMSRGFSTLTAPDGAPLRGRNAFIPISLLVLCTITLIYLIGYWNVGAENLTGSFGENLRTILNNTQSELALLWASFAALVVAGALAVGQRILTVGQVISSAVRSAHSLIFAVVILILAWGIGHTCADLNTAPFLTAAFHGTFEPWLLPAVMFGLSSLVAFSTGTSYGTMAILLPNVVVLAHTMGTESAIGGTALMIITIGAVLEGSIFGDHCSPISDTTVLSSVGTASDHLHHVRTQAPYAVLTMLVALTCGYVPVALLRWPPELALALGTGVIVLFLLLLGRRPDAAPARAASSLPASSAAARSTEQ